MIGLDGFRERMKDEAEKTRKVKTVHVSGRDLDEALQQASLELSLPLRVIEYEVLERGHRSFMGMRASPWRIIAYETAHDPSAEKQLSLEEELDLGSYRRDEPTETADADGRFSVRLSAEGALVKVFPPIGEGIPIIAEDLAGALHDRLVTDIDSELIAAAVERADEVWIKVGSFDYNPAGDAMMTLDVDGEGRRAYIIVHPPEEGGADISAQDIRGFLENNRIVLGILDDAVTEFENFPVYGTPYLTAEGVEPVNGTDAKVIYNFETEPDRIHIQEREDGSVDFKELGRFQNVVKGQPLARKIPPGPSRDGRTVYGGYIPAKDGRDLEIGLGKNVTITDNGSTVVAAASGHVMLKHGKINVDTVLVIPGNVDARTGNVNALGAVEIKGSVEDGFSVSAGGKIEVSGYVGKANLRAGGDIIVSRGINGGEGNEFGDIVAGKSIWSSFIQNARAEAGEYVIVSAGIVNSDVSAHKKVLCKGRRAKIVGGHVRASEEVNAVILGSPGGAETLVEVGFDPKASEEIEQLKKQRDALDAERDTVDLNLHGLKRQVKAHRRRLSKEKEQLFNELRLKHNALHKKLAGIEDEIQKRLDYLESLSIHGKVSASRKVLAGVVLRIRDVEYRVKDSYESAVTFILEDDYIQTMKYHDIEEDLTRK